MKQGWFGLRSAVLAVVVAALLTGCSRRASLTLSQPQARPAQQRLKLSSNWAFTDVEGPWRLVQLDFPLPGGVDGPRDFRFLFLVPTGTGWFDVSPGGSARGFLIQAAPGELRGKSLAAGGRIRVRDYFTSPREKRVDVDVRFEDGSSARGSARVISDDRELRAFRGRYSADIAAIKQREAPATNEADGAGLAADAGAETSPRRKVGAHE